MKLEKNQVTGWIKSNSHQIGILIVDILACFYFHEKQHCEMIKCIYNGARLPEFEYRIQIVGFDQLI